MKEKLKTTERIEVKRSELNINPYNPKIHDEDVVKKQAKNIKRVGYLGGIVWNKTSGNIIDGHRRVFALDKIHKYDGTPNTDYTLTVDVCEFDDKTEKEQMTYMAIGNTRADYSLIAQYAHDIDINDIGLGDYDINQINSYLDAEIDIEVNNFDDLISNVKEEDIILHPAQQHLNNTNINATPSPISYEERKQIALQGKQDQREQKIMNSQENRAYVTLSFDDYETKADFMELYGFDPTFTIVKGEDLLQKLQEE